MEEQEDISGDIESVEHYLGELFQVPVGVCIADTDDIVRDALGYEISDLRRTPDPACVTGFQYVARIEWAPGNDGDSWRLLQAHLTPLCAKTRLVGLRGVSVVELEDAAEAFTAPHRACSRQR